MNRTFLDAMLDRMNGQYWSHALYAIASSESVVTIDEAVRITNKVQSEGHQRDKVILLDILGNAKSDYFEFHQLMIAVSDTDRVQIASLSPLCTLSKRSDESTRQAIERSVFNIVERLGFSKMPYHAIESVFRLNMDRAAAEMLKGELTTSMISSAWHNNYLFDMVVMPGLSRLIEKDDSYALQDIFDELCEMETEPHDSIATYLIGILSERIRKGSALKVEQKLLARLALWEPAAINFMLTESFVAWEAIVIMAEMLHLSDETPSTISFVQKMFCGLMAKHRGLDTWEDAVMIAAMFVSQNDIASLLEGATDEEESYLMSILSGM